MAIDAATENLFEIDHIVVLMMENRSFDHVLGYLRNAGMPDVNGLTGTETNAYGEDPPYAVFPFPAGETAFHQPGQPFDKSLDPCHGPDCVHEQLSGGNGGFVRNFVEQKHPPADKRGLVMGYYTAEHLPVYDFLARQFCVCDAWHCSIPGDTWPNRVFALTGRPAKRAQQKGSLVQKALSAVGLGSLSTLPIYDNVAFTRFLHDDQWRWYAHDPATLRAVDGTYRDPGNPRGGNFGFFDRQTVSILTQAVEDVIVSGNSFLDDAASNSLRPVTWIDPNFIDLHVLDPTSNDDHPPSDIVAGQALVLDVYDALTRTANWENTLLVVTYDEHGGFYDHVAPPPANDGSGFSTYGVRVPALVIGPRVSRTVSHTLFDHTSLLKTILTRFAPDVGAALAAMGPRTEAAAHLGELLLPEPRTDIARHDEVSARIAQWRAGARARRAPAPGGGASVAPDGAGRPVVLNDFQQEFAQLALELRKVVPAGHP